MFREQSTQSLPYFEFIELTLKLLVKGGGAAADESLLPVGQGGGKEVDVAALGQSQQGEVVAGGLQGEAAHVVVPVFANEAEGVFGQCHRQLFRAAKTATCLRTRK